MSEIEMFVRVAELAADVAGAAIRPYFRAGVAADLKGDASPVTVADRTAELAIKAVISQRFPAHGILGEEFGVVNQGATYQWVLDPIDGTRAFITGRPVFGTLIALLRDGVPVLGVIDQCVTGERWVGAGGVTRFRGPFGGVAGGRTCSTLAEAELSCTSPEMFVGDEFARWQKLSRAVKRTSYGGDCYAYGLIALGQIDIAAESTMKIWDWAALVPVIEGAGGRMTDWRGRALTAESAGDVLAVGDGALLGAAVEILAE